MGEEVADGGDGVGELGSGLGAEHVEVALEGEEAFEGFGFGVDGAEPVVDEVAGLGEFTVRDGVTAEAGEDLPSLGLEAGRPGEFELGGFRHEARCGASVSAQQHAADAGAASLWNGPIFDGGQGALSRAEAEGAVHGEGVPGAGGGVGVVLREPFVAEAVGVRAGYQSGSSD